MPKHEKFTLDVQAVRPNRDHNRYREIRFHDQCLTEGYRNPAKSRITDTEDHYIVTKRPLNGLTLRQRPFCLASFGGIRFKLQSAKTFPNRFGSLLQHTSILPLLQHTLGQDSIIQNCDTPYNSPPIRPIGQLPSKPVKVNSRVTSPSKSFTLTNQPYSVQRQAKHWMCLLCTRAS